MIALLFSCLFTASSCGDEPDWFIGYYLEIDSEVSLSLSDENENQGTIANTGVDVLSNALKRMKAAMQEAYPEDTRSGNDAAVLTALDEIYRKYKHAYADKEGHIVCVAKLYRAKKDREVVKESTQISTYHFGILPVNVVAVDY